MRHLGLFAKEPVPGRVKTRLASTLGDEHAAKLYWSFVLDLTERFPATGDRRWIGFTPVNESSRTLMRDVTAASYDLWPQPEAGLGDRITGFFAHTITSGATQTVLIGSDSPNLPRELVDQAFAALNHADVVLGPATDGGYYLIGTRRPLDGVLDGVRWSTALTLADTATRIAAAGLTLSLLPPWYDIDTMDDLITLSGHYRAARITNPDAPVSHTEAWLAAHSDLLPDGG